ncbi:MAG: hypothetical protein SFU25_02645, partial [Candidatus Caenarcaniphilales bacterium]|nr:hypothetical protein [Candidatus Caenarcaniphilales bacterium]
PFALSEALSEALAEVLVEVEEEENTTENKILNNQNILNDLPIYSPDELEQMRVTHKFPINDPKLHNLLYNYDLVQPTRDFTLKRKLRVASLNVKKGDKVDKLKLLFEADPLFEKVMQEFPELEDVQDYDSAIKVIGKEAESQGLDRKERVKEFKSHILDYASQEASKLSAIFPFKKYQNRSSLSEDEYAALYQLIQELHHIANSDIITIQEADWGMPRSQYRHTVKEFAEHFGYGYVFGAEFIENLDDGTRYSTIKDLDLEHFKGLQGNAIVSKWPIKNIQLLRFDESFTEDPSMQTMAHRRCYDWWKDELPKVGPFEKVVHKGIKLVFDEDTIVPSVRLGSRMAVIADIKTPQGEITIATTHLENRGSPKCRRFELAQLTNFLRDNYSENPLAITGDMNTTNEEARRPYFRHAIAWYIKNQLELSTLIAQSITTPALFIFDIPSPVPIPATVQILNQAREWRNPPGLGSAERKLFKRVIHNFSFEDGTVFDTRGNSTLNDENSSKFLSDSNESTPLGYRPTYCFQRNYKHLFCMKLDWIFVKNKLTHCSRKHSFKADNAWAPHYPRTLMIPTTLSGITDHAYISADLIIPSQAE